MQIAQVLSGYSLGEADILRRAMGKKDKDEMARQKSRFVDGAVERGVNQGQADYIFELVNEFAGYGFNKSHAAAYALISFRTAYLKALYPTEFIAATMSLDITNVDKLAQFYQEARRMEVAIKPPCINRSFADFEVRDGAVLYALGALKNVGVEAMRHVVEIRQAGGDFTDLFDFARRVDTRIVNKRAFENLARGGAFDALEPNRARALAAAATLQSIGSRAAQERASDQVSLFGEALDVMAEPELPDPAGWSHIEQLDHELAAIGFYFSGHPLEAFSKVLEHKKVVVSTDIETRYTSGSQAMRLAGVVRKRQERISRRGKRFAYLALSDSGGDFEVFVGEELLATHRDILEAGSLIELTAKIDRRDGEIKIFTNTISSLETRIDLRIAGLKLRLRSVSTEALDTLQACLESLKDAPAKHKGYIELVAPIGAGREAHWRLPDKMGLDPSIQAAIKATKLVETLEEIAA